MSIRKIVFSLLALSFIFCGTDRGDAEPDGDETVAIEGRVSDSAGAAIPNANISVYAGNSAQLMTTSSNAGGDYSLKLAPGSYTFDFAAAGFKKAEIRSVRVAQGEALRLNATLTAGPENEVVTVDWKPAAVVASMPSGSESPDGADSVKEIPLASRNYTQAAGLASGVSAAVSNATAMGLNSQGVTAGSSPTNNYMMEGVSVATQTGDADNPPVPNPDAIEAHQVQSWTYSAGPERYAGANIGVATKSGTNAYHGTLFEFVRNDIFNANDFFLKRMGLPRPVLKQNQFGLTFGGPILKDRIFFFLSYQGTRQSNGVAKEGFSSGATLPPLPDSRTAANLGAAFCPADHPGDSRYATFFGGVQVACDGSNINPVAINLLNAKLPNGKYAIPGSTNGTFQAVPTSIPASFREDQAIFNTDFVLTAKHKLTQKFFYSHAPQISNFTGGSNGLPGMKTYIVSGNMNAQLRLHSVLTSSLLNELIVAGQRDQLSRNPKVPFTNEQIGITSIVPTINLLDVINVAGLFSFGGASQWEDLKVNLYHVADTASWIHGKHAIRFGFEVDRRQWNVHVLGYARGTLNFPRFPDLLLGLPGCPPGSTTCSVSSPIVNGVVTNGSRFSNILGSVGPGGGSAFVTSPDGITHSYRYSDTSGYFQDTMQLHPRLTVTAGLRWDFFGFPSDSIGNLTNFWPSLSTPWKVPDAGGTYVGLVVPSNSPATPPAGVTRNSRRSSLPNDPPMSSFAPRLSFSLQPLKSNSMVVRGGFGMFYDRTMSWDTLQQPQAAVPYAVPVGGIGQANYRASFANPYRSATLGWGMPRSVDFASSETSNLILYALAEDFGSPLTYKWNFEIQQQMPLGILADVAYAGAHSIHLQTATRQLNIPELASPTHPVYGLTSSTIENASLRVPYLGLAPNGLNTNQTGGSAKYNGLQATLVKRSSNGFRIQASYMFSKTLTTLGAAPPLSGGSSGLSKSGMNSNNPLDAGQQYGPDPVPAPQRLALNYGWDLPFKVQGFAGKIVNGWGFSGTAVIQSGTPLTISDSRGGTIYGNSSVSRAQYCPGMSAANVPSKGGVKDRLSAYFNKSAFCMPPSEGNGTGYGNSSVGIIRGPGQTNFDFAVSRGLEFKRSRIELRVEFFNAFNHPQFALPNVNVSDGTFGQITATSVNPRLIQFALKYSF